MTTDLTWFDDLGLALFVVVLLLMPVILSLAQSWGLAAL